MPIQYEQANEQATEQAVEQATEQATEQQNEHIITILNYTFNYLNNKEEKKEIFENISESQKNGIILNLKRLEIYVNEPEILLLIPTNNLLGIKVKYYAIKELYFSPYAIYLQNLSKEVMDFKFLKTSKYVDITKNVYHFTNYFIKSLQNSLSNKESKRGD